MDMGLTVVVVLVVLAVIAGVTLLALQGRRRRQEQQRIEASEHRHEAEIRSASAERREAEASERAARAEREQAQAREQAARARQDREAAEARHAAADRVDPDHRTDDADRDTTDRDTTGRDTTGRDTADPAARTDDLRLDADESTPASGGRHEAAPAVPHTDGTSPDPQPSRPQDGMSDRPSNGQPSGTGRHAAASPRVGEGADPSARTDNLRLGEGGSDQRVTDGRDEGEQSQSPATESGGGWHGPTASGGFRAVDPAGRDTAQAGPEAPRHADAPAATTASTGGVGEPSAPDPELPSQRTGEHDRDQRETAEGEHSGVRGLADRLLRRRN
jgi:hypothetical protein